MLNFIQKSHFKLIIILYIISNFSNSQITPTSNVTSEKKNYSLQPKGMGAKCKEKLKNYREKFSSVKSYILTDKNINKYISEYKLTLLYIHSACTKESENFIPIIKYISEYYQNTSIISTLEITDDENNINNQYNFRSLYYPIILLKIKGIKGFYPYTGYYNSRSIITFVTKYMYKSELIKIKDDKNSINLLEQMINPKYTYLSVFILNDKYVKIFKKFSHSLPYVLLGDCIGCKLCEKTFGKNIYRYSDFVLVKMTNKTSDFEYNDEHINIKPEFIPNNYTNYQELKEFIYLNTLPKVFNFTEFNKVLMISSFAYTIIYIKGPNEKKTNSEISKILEKAINLDPKKIKIGAILDPLNNINENSLMDNFRLELEDYSLYGNVQIQKYEKNGNIIVYRMDLYELNEDKEIKEKRVLNFVKMFNEGKLKPELISENRPKKHPKDNLRMIVAKTFDQEITYNDNQAVVLCLLTMNLTNLRKYENIIDILTDKLDALNNSLIFGFMDIGYNYMEDLPKFDPVKTPYYRYYFSNKSFGCDDFKGNYSKIEEIEDWIAINYGKENGEEYTEVIRKYIESVNEEMRKEEEAKRKKEEQFERDVEAGNVTNFEFILGDGSNEAINITEQKIQKILQKRMEAERRKKEQENKNKTNNKEVNTDL